MKTKQKTQIEEFLKSLKIENLDLMDYVDIEDIDLDSPFESIYDMLDEKNGFDIDIIYYYNAIEYLKEHDNSLGESLNLAAELCFEVQNLNSEVLASLLASQNARQDFQEKQTKIDNFFNNL